MTKAKDFWVFGYGSLMWRPGFTFEEMRPARLDGWRRDMCVQSIHYRGTPDFPGLVSGLTEGGDCVGRAYRVHPDQVEEAKAYLDARELVTHVYVPSHLEVTFDDGDVVTAYGYVADPDHDQFAGHWPEDRKIHHLIKATGSEGRSLQYLINLVDQLALLGLNDPGLDDLLAKARSADGG